MGTLTTITAPTAEPVTLEEMKEALRVDHTDDDSLIIGLMRAARMWAEAYLNKRIASQVVELSYDRFPSSEIYLGVWPIISIDSVKYDDTASPVAEQTLVANTDYYADKTTIGGRVKSISGWPSVAVKPNAVRIRMTVGYVKDDIPDIIKEGIKVYTAALYDRDCELEKSARLILCPERFLSLVG